MGGGEGACGLCSAFVDCGLSNAELHAEVGQIDLANSVTTVTGYLRTLLQHGIKRRLHNDRDVINYLLKNDILFDLNSM